MLLQTFSLATMAYANTLIKEYLNTRLMLRQDIIIALAGGEPAGWKRLYIHFGETNPSRFSRNGMQEIEIYNNGNMQRAEAFMDRVGGLIGYTVEVFAKGLAACNMVEVALQLYPELPMGRKLSGSDLEALAKAIETRVVDISLLMTAYRQMHHETRLSNNIEDATTLGAWLIQYQDNAQIKKIFNEYAQRSSLNAWIIA